MHKDPSTSCSEKGEVQSKNNCCTGAEQEESEVLYRYTVCAQARKPADIPWAGGCPEPTDSTIPMVNPEGNCCTCQEEKMSSNHQDAKSLVRRVLSRAARDPLHSSGMFWKKVVGDHLRNSDCFLQFADMACIAQETRSPHSSWPSWVTRSVVTVKVTAIQTLWFLLVSERDEVYAVTLGMFCPSVTSLQTCQQLGMCFDRRSPHLKWWSSYKCGEHKKRKTLPVRLSWRCWPTVIPHRCSWDGRLGWEMAEQQTRQEAHGEAGHKAARRQHGQTKCSFWPLGFVYK